MVLPPPVGACLPQDAADRLFSTFLDMMHAPRLASEAVVAVSPPIYVFGGATPGSPPQVMRMPPPAFGPGMMPGWAAPAPASGEWRFEQIAYPDPRMPRAEPSVSPYTSMFNVECLPSPTMSRPRAASQPADAPAGPNAKHNVHLVTPHLEAHCERLSSAGNPDHILLEGDVNLICRRNGQTVRIQGQRVLVHLNDGSFSVESMPESRQPAPMQRVHGIIPAGSYSQPADHAPASQAVPPIPWQRLRPVRPIDNMPDEPSKPEN